MTLNHSNENKILSCVRKNYYQHLQPPGSQSPQCTESKVQTDDQHRKFTIFKIFNEIRTIINY